MPSYVGGTGSRSLVLEPKDVIENVRIQITQFLSTLHEPKVIAGGAEGFDELLAFCAIAMKIPLYLCIPNKGYGDYYWARHSKRGQNRSQVFQSMLEGADVVEYTMEDYHKVTGIYWKSVHSNFLRNDRMVEMIKERQGQFLVYEPNSSGTKDAVARIKAADVPYTVITSDPF